MNEACGCKEKTGVGSKVMPAASLMGLEAEGIVGDAEAYREAPARHFCKWKG